MALGVLLRDTRQPGLEPPILAVPGATTTTFPLRRTPGGLAESPAFVRQIHPLRRLVTRRGEVGLV